MLNRFKPNNPKRRPLRLAPARRMLVVGGARSTSCLNMILSRLPVEIVRARTVSKGLEKLNESIIAVLITHLDRSPAPAQSILRFAQRARHRLPIFSVVRDTVSSMQSHRHYELGATEVFQWPSETFMMADAIRAHLETAQRSRVPRGYDERLDRAIRRRITRGAAEVSKLGLLINQGTVRAFGQLPSRAERAEVRATISRTPGVLYLDDSNVKIGREPKLERRVRAQLQRTPDVQQETLSSRVDDGRVTLVGTVSSKRELTRALDAISRLEGVERINNLTTISREQKRVDAKRARALNDELNQSFPRADLDVIVFGPMAVIEGTARSRRARAQIEAQARREPFVERVVDRVTVQA